MINFSIRMLFFRTHTLERPFKCTLCDKRFKTVGQRIGHMSTHTTQNDYEVDFENHFPFFILRLIFHSCPFHSIQCDICHKHFKSARILHGHKKIHGERQFNCGFCDKKFNRKYHLSLHLKRHTNHQPKRKSNHQTKKS